jgi:hypothetical protein
MMKMKMMMTRMNKRDMRTLRILSHMNLDGG